MKKALNKIFILVFLVSVLASCKKDEKKLYFEGNDTTPALSASESGPLVLDILKKNEPAITFNWTNPDYKFTTGLSSQTVYYELEFDTTGGNFTNSAKTFTLDAPSNLTATLTVGSLNAKLLAIGVPEGTARDIQIRLKASLRTSGSNPQSIYSVYSNVLSINIKPYLDTKYEVPANLYITGSATPGNWQCGCGEPELLSQKFTKVSPFLFELTIQLSANNSYLLIPVYGSWGAKYGGLGSNNTNNVFADDFKPNGGDLKAPPSTGVYKITVNFKTGRFTVAP